MLLGITRTLLLLLIILLPLGQLSRLPFGSGQQVNIYLNDLLLPTLIFAWLWQKIVIEKSFRLSIVQGWIILFAAVAAISLISGVRLVSFSEWVVSLLYLVRWVEYALVFFIVKDLVRRKQFEDVRRKIIIWFIFSFFLFAVLGLLQFIFFPDFSRFVEHGWDPHYYRVLSTFFDPNFAGIFLTMGFLIGLDLLLTTKVHSRYKGLVVTNLVVLLTAIVLTFSRSTYLAFLVGVSVIGLLRSRRFLMSAYFAALLVFLFVPRVQTRVVGAFHLDKTARFRIESWSKTAKIIRDYPILGVGFNTFRYVQQDYGYFRDDRGVQVPSARAGAGADSSLLFLWATSGILGLIAYLGLLVTIWLKAVDVRRKLFGSALLAIIPAWVVHSQFVNSLFYPWLMEAFWVLAALL